MKIKHSQACLEAHEGVGSDEGFTCIDNCSERAKHPANEVKHTPGPWSNNGGQIEGPGGYPNVVAHVGIVNEQTEQDTSNARLIAAAPELLEALHSILNVEAAARLGAEGALKGLDTAYHFDKVRAAIAKAEGR